MTFTRGGHWGGLQPHLLPEVGTGVFYNHIDCQKWALVTCTAMLVAGGGHWGGLQPH